MRGRVWFQLWITSLGDCADETSVAVGVREGRREDGWYGLHEDGNTKVKRCGRTVGMRKEEKKRVVRESRPNGHNE